MRDYDDDYYYDDDSYAPWFENEEEEDEYQFDAYVGSKDTPGFEGDVDEFSGEYVEEKDPLQIDTADEADALEDGVVLLDADGYAFQKRRGEWFMAGAQYGATEFSGQFPARKLV